MKVVLDTNILISATMWENSVSNKLLKKLAEEDIEIFSSQEILEEYRKVLKRDFKYEDDKINEIILELLLYLKIIELKDKIDIIKDDPDDNKILECALTSNSKYILSYDNHLLKLKEFQGIEILKPEEFFNILNN